MLTVGQDCGTNRDELVQAFATRSVDNTVDSRIISLSLFPLHIDTFGIRRFDGIVNFLGTWIFLSQNVKLKC